MLKPGIAKIPTPKNSGLLWQHPVVQLRSVALTSKYYVAFPGDPKGRPVLPIAVHSSASAPAFASTLSICSWQA
jgi:hypothetical protein